MSLFNKPNKPTAVTAKSTEEKAPAEFFINIGFKKVYGDVERFVNIPLYITADNIRSSMERVEKNCNPNAPEDWVEFTQDRLMLGEDLIALFAQIPEGQNIVNKDIPEKHDLAYFADLEVQFVHKDMHRENTVQKPTNVTERRNSFKR